MANVITPARKAIQARLQAPLEALNCRVEGIPSGKPAPIARLNCYYSGSDFSGPQLMQQMAQDELLEFQLLLELNDQRSHEPAETFLEEIKKYLTGFNALGKGDPGYVRRVRIQPLEKEGWGYVITFVQPHDHRQERV